ncbi:MAG: NADH-quinone oxidoreductase subunit H [Deltaproteobacteria bacterium]|nr:MAG: NADH-quinone oxidoreductase subunit H [Deltaproteobacteria bacterium]
MDLVWELLIILLKIVVVVLLFAFPIGSLMTLLGDRKQSSLIQNRIGPNRARLPGINHPLVGIPHFLADGLKMIFKEDIIPRQANRFWHTLAPAISLFPAIALWAVIPFSDHYCTGTATMVDYRDVCVDGAFYNLFSISNLEAGLLYVFAISAVSVYGAAIAGWASNSKFSLLGGLRSSAQMISYEVTMGLSLAGILIIYGTLNLNEMVVVQGQLLWDWLPMWGIVVQPLAFFLFLAAMMAETKRAPFDVPEGESEIVAGYFTEFSSMKFAVIQLSEYVATVFVGSLVSTVFLGGWQVPWLYGDGFYFGNTDEPSIPLPYWLVIVLRVGSFSIKTLFILWLQFMLRWTLPRFRYDQIMTLGWKILLPLSLANLVITAFVVLVLL